MGTLASSRWWRPARGVVASLTLACSAVHASGLCAALLADERQRIDLVQDIPGAGDLAAPANGQTLYILDEARGAVVAIDPQEPSKRWTAVAARDDAGGTTGPVAIGCVDTSMLALLCHARDGWSLQTHRVQPGATADPGKPAQTVMIGKSPADAGGPATAPAPPAAPRSGDVRQIGRAHV